VFYTADDHSEAILASQDIIRAIWFPSPGHLFVEIERMMNSKGLTQNFASYEDFFKVFFLKLYFFKFLLLAFVCIVGDMEIQNLKFATYVEPDLFVKTANYVAIFVYVFVGLCLIVAILARLQARASGAENVRIMGLVYFAIYTWDFIAGLCSEILKFLIFNFS